MKKTYTILYLEDCQEDVELFTEALKQEYISCEVTWVNGREAFESALIGGWSYDLIFADFALPDLQGEEALRLAKRHCRDVPFIFISGTMGEEKAVECLRSGATDYVLKGNLSRLAPVVRRALEEARESWARREAEAARTRVVSLLRATLESTSEGILVVDLAGKITTYNRKFMALCGIPDYVMAPMEMDRVLQFLLDQFQDPEAFLAEARLLGAHPERESFGKLRTQSERVLEEYSRPHRIGNQTVGRVYTFQDVTAREQDTDRLTGLAHSRQKLMEATGAGGIVPWCLSEETLLIADFAESLLGLPAGGLPKDLKELEAIIHPEELDRFRQALERPHTGVFDVRMRKGDGTWAWTRWNVARDPAAGYRGIFMDVTQQIRAEEAFADRRRTQGMASLAEKFTRVFRKSLQGLQAPLEQLQRASALDGTLEAPLQSAAGTLASLETLLGEVNAAASCLPDKHGALDIPEAAKALQARFAPGLEPGIRLNLVISPKLPKVFMSPAHFDAILDNLVRNAREALEGSGTLTLRITARRPQGPTPSKGLLSLEVEDNGQGIPAGVQSRMFDLFFTTRENAFGLGLAVVRSIVEAYQGSIQLESAPGRGSTVRILLPATQ